MAASTALAAPGSLPGPHFSPGTVCQARTGIVPLLLRPTIRSELDTEVLFGERVTVLAYRKGWMRVRAHLDGKEGFVEPRHFSDQCYVPTHRVRVGYVATTMTRPVQNPVHLELGMNALVRVIRKPEEGKFSRILHGGWVNNACIVPVDEFERDFVEVACRFMRVPYFWGSRTGKLIDCSALVQAALLACGHECPRDSGPQSQTLGVPIYQENGLCRGDLVFWNGHVGIMLDEWHIVHASDNTMAVVVEPLQYVIERRRCEELPHKQEITVVRRLPWYAWKLRCRS